MSDVYDFDAKTGTVPVSVSDKRAQDLLWNLSKRVQPVDPAFARQVQDALKASGYVHGKGPGLAKLDALMDTLMELPDGALGTITQPVAPYKQDLIPIVMHGLRLHMETVKAQMEKPK
jgi:hypothetical protein